MNSGDRMLDDEKPLRGGETYLDSDDWGLLEALVSAFVLSPSGVNLARFRVEHEHHRERLDALERYWFIERAGRSYKPTLATLSYLRSKSSEARILIETCQRMFDVLKALYRRNPDGKVSTEEVTAMADVQLEHSRPGLSVLSSTALFDSASWSVDPTMMLIQVSERILNFKTWDDFLADKQLGHSALLGDNIFGPNAFSEVPDEIEMVDALPPWADVQMSGTLPQLRARGESQILEYMQSFPDQARELAKEIAAFATSNAGTILLGVEDGGALMGMSNLESAEQRDGLTKRIEGICTSSIKPAITPTVLFAVESGKTVVAIVVPKGTQPVYYTSNVPYLRHLTQSRPAEPHEVADLHRARDVVSNRTEDDERSRFTTKVVQIIHTVMIYADQASDRQVNPWFEEWRSTYKNLAHELRELSSGSFADEAGIGKKLDVLADALDEVASLRMSLGNGNDLNVLVRAAAELARQLDADIVGTTTAGEPVLKQCSTLIKAHAKKLDGLAARFDTMVNGNRLRELQSEASEIGFELLRLASYNIDALGTGVRDQLRRIGRDLHLVETANVYLDGGASINAIGRRVGRAANDLANISRQLA